MDEQLTVPTSAEERRLFDLFVAARSGKRSFVDAVRFADEHDINPDTRSELSYLSSIIQEVVEVA